MNVAFVFKSFYHKCFIAVSGKQVGNQPWFGVTSGVTCDVFQNV